MDCIFCKIVNGEIPSTPLFEDNKIVVIPDIHPQAPVHLLVIPKIHYGEFLELPDEELLTVFSVAKRIISEKSITSYRLVNNGKGAALIDHFHLHILGKVDKTRGL